MRSFILSTLGFLTLLAAGASIANGTGEAAPRNANNERHWLPEPCILMLDVERALQADGERLEDSPETRWNYFYRLGIEAINNRDLEQAEIDFCQALEAASSLGPRDYRFAETLDELGLVAFMNEDYESSEALQGAAAAEMLLAVGPPAGDLAATAEKSCKSSVATYMVRLGWIFERQGREREIGPLMRQPYRILERGYVPFDSMTGRLEWLISQYLLAEDFAAADWLSALRDDQR